MKTRRPQSWRPAYWLFGACASCYLLLLLCYEYDGFPGARITNLRRGSRPGRQPQSRDQFSSLHLTTEQCEATFPHLTKDIRDTVALGAFEIHPSGDGGPLQVQIKDGQLLVFQPEHAHELALELLDAQTATLHLLHRALLTSPSALPPTILTLNVHDQPFGAALSYTRPAFRPGPGGASSSRGPALERAFLMPHLSFWAWPLPSVGSVSRAAAAVDAVEAALPFAAKDARLAWRGTLGWDSAHYPRQREALLLRVAESRSSSSGGGNRTGGKMEGQAAAADWADVQALTGYEVEEEAGADADAGGANASVREKKGGGRGGGNALMVEDFCRYRYVLYTEGVTYSGRLLFLQMCGSVLLAPPVAWLQHTAHLVRPVWSCDLAGGGEEATWEPDEGAREAWPGRFAPGEANAVFVAPDWSDLERTVRWLEANPGVAEGIARRQRELFVGRGYLSPAAEACYWRALIRGWSEVVRYDSAEWAGRELVSWETFALGRNAGKVRA